MQTSPRRSCVCGPTSWRTCETVFHYRVGLVVYLLATAIAFLSPWISFAIYGAIALYYLFPRGVDADAVAEDTGSP